MDLKSDIIQPSKLSEADIAVWNQFSIAAPNLAVAFLSYPYVLAAEKSFPNVRVCRIQSAGHPILFFPFQFKTRAHQWFGIGQRLAGELSDYFGVVGNQAAHLDPKTLLRLSGLRALLFTHLDESQCAFGLSGEAPELGHLIDLPNGGGAFWQERRTLDKKFVGDTERRERNLVRDFGSIRFDFQSPNVEADLEKLIDTKRRQYSRTGVKDALGERSTVAFLKALSKTSHPLCSGLLSTLYAGKTWVASHFGLRCSNTLHYWFPVYNPELSSYGPGRLLLKQILNVADEHGISRIDRGAGDTVAKRDFSTSQHHFHRGLWSRRGIGTLGYRAGLSVLWRLASLTARTGRPLK
jgi:CelD/BcsL family acetyltransferase involved in cellulose biosynthesis